MTTTTEYQVSGMSCAHCETAVTEEVTAVPGVQGIEVSAATGRLLVVGSTELDDALGDRRGRRGRVPGGAILLMKAPLKIGIYAAVLAAIFGVSYVAAGALIPDAVAADWSARASESAAEHGEQHGDDTVDEVGAPRCARFVQRAARLPAPGTRGPGRDG